MDLIYKKILEITNKWYNEHRHGHFIVFKDGDIFNESNKNIEYIEIKLAFEGRKKFNWTEGLLKDEIVFVNNYWDKICVSDDVEDIIIEDDNEESDDFFYDEY